jgi:hypothetical protein
VCCPIRGNLVVEWLNVAPAHCVVEWHSEQSCGKPDATWLGFVVDWYFDRWQEAHKRDVPAYLPPA